MDNDNKENPPCPTSVLLYLATGLRYHSTVAPWYDRIQELSDGATFWHREFQAATIYGIYPEIKEACEYFKQSKETYHKNNSNLFKPVNIPFLDKVRKRKLLHDFKKMERNTIEKYGLREFCDIYNLSDEQKKNIRSNLAKEADNHIKKELKDCSQVVSALTYLLKDEVVKTPANSTTFADAMKSLDKRLHNSDKGDDIYSEYFPEQKEVVKQILEMRDKGILNGSFVIVKFSEFQNSELLKSFPYRGKTYNLEDKAKIPARQSGKIIDK